MDGSQVTILPDLVTINTVNTVVTGDILKVFVFLTMVAMETEEKTLFQIS